MVPHSLRHPFRRHDWQIVSVEPDDDVAYFGSPPTTLIREVCMRTECRGRGVRIRVLAGLWTAEMLGLE